MGAENTGGVLCRRIEPQDIAAVIDCLCRNFPTRPRDYWARGLEALGRRESVGDRPRYGQLLEAGGAVVGALLQIYSEQGGEVRCNLSSWCVDPAYRAFSYALQARATRERGVVYINVTPAPPTTRFLEATGFRRFAAGRVLFVPLLSPARPGLRVLRFSPEAPEAAELGEDRRRLLADHAALGCEALIGAGPGGVAPFVFQRRRLGPLPGLHLIYCGSLADLALFARPLGRHFARRGLFFALVDAERPAPGLVGRFFRRDVARYFKGEATPQPCNLAYTEFVLLGR